MFQKKMSFNCLECQQEFDSERSLHAHIKKHDMFLHDYYVKHFNRRDLLTGDLLPFKNKEQYFQTYFLSSENQDKFFNQQHSKDLGVCMILLDMLCSKTKDGFAPCEAALNSYGLPSISVFKKFFGSYSAAVESCGSKLMFSDKFPKECLTNPNPKIFIDTREQQPLSFANHEFLKLDLGDYCVEPKYFNYTFVDRKSESDFKSTVSEDNLDRFKRELSRAREQESFIFVVVESDFQQIQKNNGKNSHKSNLAYIYHNMRALQMEFKDCCQFVFSSNRKNSEKLIPLLLVHGKKLWNVDLQFYINGGLLNGLD